MRDDIYIVSESVIKDEGVIFENKGYAIAIPQEFASNYVQKQEPIPFYFEVLSIPNNYNSELDRVYATTENPYSKNKPELFYALRKVEVSSALRLLERCLENNYNEDKNDISSLTREEFNFLHLNKRNTLPDNQMYNDNKLANNKKNKNNNNKENNT